MRITYKNNEALSLSSGTWNIMKSFLKHKYLSPQNYCGNPYENSNRPRVNIFIGKLQEFYMIYY
jgi:hypothetical protein